MYIQNIMPQVKWIVVFFVSLLTLIIHDGNAQDQDGKTVFTGQVLGENGQPLPGVNVYFSRFNKGAVTNSDGKFTLKGLPKGTYKVSFSIVGYANKKQTVSLEPGDTKNIDVELERSNMQLQEVTVTGTPQTTEQMATSRDVQSLSGRQKQQEQAASLGASVDEMAGVSHIETGSQSGKPVIRGLSGQRIRVLFDGFPMDFQQYGVRHMPSVDPLMSERIELVQGPASVLYGSDAMGGAINIIPNQIPYGNEDEPFLAGEVYGEFGSNNTEWSSGLQLKGSVGNFGITGSFVKRSADNINAPSVRTADQTGNSTDPRFAGELDHTDFDQLNGTAGLGYNSDFGSVRLNYMRWQNEHNFLLPNGKGLGQRITNDMAQVKSVINLGGNYVLKPGFSYLRNVRQSNKKGNTRNDLPDLDERAHLDILLETYNARLELQHGDIGPVKGRVGLDYMQQEQDTRGVNEPLVPGATVRNYDVFMFEKATFGQWTINAGVRYDHRSQEAAPNKKLNLPDQDNDETEDVLEQTYNVVSGSFGVNYRIMDQLAASVNVGRGFRAPSLFDLHADGVHGGVAAFQKGDPNLDEETSLNTDVSLKWRSEKIQAQVTGYRNAIDNYIILLNTGEKANDGKGPPIWRNTQTDAVLWGSHIDAKVEVFQWLQLHGGYEMVRGRNTGDDLDNVDELPLLPADRLNGDIRFRQDQLGPLENSYLKIGVRHTFQKDAAGRYEPFWQFGNLDKFPFGVASTDAYTLLNVGIGFTVPFLERSIKVDVQGSNLLNNAYRDFLNTYKGYALNPGRDVTVKVSIPFDTRTFGK